MPIKSIIVHLGDDAHVESRMKASVQLAAKHAAHLTGMFVLRDVDMGMMRGRGASMQVMESRLEKLAEKANDVANSFAKLCDAAGVDHRWVQEDGDHVEVLADHARVADLMVVSQFDAKGLDDRLRLHVAERLILTAGVPVLVLPQGFDGELDFNKVAVAWNSSRESVRAVRDSLDILRAADKVVGIAIGAAQDTGRVPLEQMQRFLGRHGVKLEIERDFGETRNAGDILLKQAADQGADLLIMGAYGRPGWQEIIMGGATRTVLSHMDRPVLMSH